MIAEIHSGPHLCPSLTRVRALPAVERGHRPAARKLMTELPAHALLGPAVLETALVAASELPKRISPARNRKTENIEYRLIFAGAFAIFFVAAVFERALPTRWANVQGAAVKKPILSQVKEAASISAGYAFMG